MKLKVIMLFTLFTVTFFVSKAQTIIPINQNKAISIRGLSVVNDNIAWVSGTKGTIGITTDGGINWRWQQIPGFEKADFRDIEAFSASEAVIIASGTPAYILKTTDGGSNWKTKFEKADTSYFLDAMDFKNKQHGFVLGDPIAGKFLLLETLDGGETWAAAKNPPVALQKEAAFAASGTCLRVNNYVTIVTGGSASRILIAPINGKKWAYKLLPLTNGLPSRGAFSVADNPNTTIIIGGNYAKDKQTDSVAYIIPKAKIAVKSNIPVIGPAGYQSCVEYIKNDTFVSTGTSGTNITTDGGKTWYKLDNTSFNVCRKAKQGSLILLAGDKGKLAILKF